MRNTLLKWIRIKITFLVVAIVLLFMAAQTPWLKRQIARSLTQRLALMTQSEVTVRSYEGLIPLNFDLYQLTFSQKGEVWLTLERLSLNRTLILFFLWKNKKIDVEVVHPTLRRKPFLSQKSSSSFEWPTLPFKSLSIQLKAYQVEIAPSLTNHKLPLFNSFSNLHIRKGGADFRLISKLNSPELSEVEFTLDTRGFKAKNLLYIQLHGIDLKHKIGPYFFSTELPSFNANVKLSGEPEAFLAFFKPSKTTLGSFQGTLQGHFILDAKPIDLVQDFFNEKSLHLTSQLTFKGCSGLSFSDLKLKGPHLILSGNGLLNREHQFEQTQFSGTLFSLSKLSTKIEKPIDGEIQLKAQLQGFYQNPQIDLSFTAPSLQTNTLQAQQISGTLSLQKINLAYQGKLNLKALLNHEELSCKTDFSILSPNEFSLKNGDFIYGSNTLQTRTFSKNQESYQGRIEFNCHHLALFSPFISHALHGNAFGEAVFTPLKESSKPFLDLTVQGDHFQILKLNLEDYFFRSKGLFDSKDLYAFQGDLFFKNQRMHYENYQFEELEINLRPKNKKASFELESKGNLSISSSGNLTLYDQSLSLFLRTLDGEIQDYPFTLLKSLQIDFSKKEFLFSPLFLKVNRGSLFVNLDPKKQEIQTRIEKFPIQVLSSFVPKFDIRGLVNLSGSFTHLATKMTGHLQGFLEDFLIEDYQNMPPYQGEFDFCLAHNSLAGSSSFYGAGKDQAHLSIKIPLSFHFYPFKWHLEKMAQSEINIDYQGKINPFIQTLLPENHLLEGQASLSFQLKGPMMHPKVTGMATLENGYYENLFLGLVLKNISAKIQGINDQLQLVQLNAHDNSNGSIEAKGNVTLNFDQHMPYKVQIQMNKGRVIQFDFLDAAFDGSLLVKGNLKRALLKGDLDVLETHVTIPNRIGSGFPKLPITYLYPRDISCSLPKTSFLPSAPLDFDLHLKALETITLKGRGLDTVWKGDLTILGNDRDPKFEGELINTEGTFVFGGQVLKLQEGFIKFDGSLFKKTYINLQGSTNIHNALITANLTGPLLGPKLSFQSDPPHTQTEILSLILFNEPVQKLTPFQAVALTHSLATLSGVYLGPDLVDKFRKGIGVDQLSFGSSLSNGGDYTTIQLGKYITRHVLITLNRPLSIGTSPFIITAHVRGGFQLQTFFDENEISKIFLQWKLSY